MEREKAAGKTEKADLERCASDEAY